MREKGKKTTKNKDTRGQGRIEAIVKGWELNDFVGHLSYVFTN